MSAYTFGFIGAGNMGSALARAACRTLPAGEIILSNRTAAKSKALAGELGCTAGDNRTVAAEAAYIFLGVKPQMMAGLLSEIAPVLAERRDSFVLVTMAAGLTMERIAAMAGGDYPVIRIMPNTPCAVGAGVVLYDANERVSETALEKFTAGMAGAGLLDRLEERLGELPSITALLDARKTPEEILSGLLGDFDLEILEKKPVQFHCDCSRERVERAIVSIGKKEIREMIEEGKPIEAGCQFCNKKYSFSVEELEELLQKAVRP